MENHSIQIRALKTNPPRVQTLFVLFLVLLFSSGLTEDARDIDLEFRYHDGIPAGADYLYPYSNGAIGAFVFPIEYPGWVESIEFTKVRFYHEDEAGRPFKILLIRRDFEDEEYRIFQDTTIHETTCTECWEEVITSFHPMELLGWDSLNYCYGLFVNIVPDEGWPLYDYFTMYWDGIEDHPYSSAWFYDVDEDGFGYLDSPAYNSWSGYGEYLIDIDATLWGYSATGETTFSEIKLKFGVR
ncbi:hypothetical protein H8E52_07475 [bacterium]|nr:hypothetical protein [bacterium]